MFIKDIDSCDDEYNCYHPAVQLKIFNYMIDKDDLENICINTSTDFDINELLPKITEYLNRLQNCHTELIQFFALKTDHPISDDWFDSLEVYSADITFNSPDDFGATIECGDNIFADHLIEFDFKQNEIIQVRLNG